MANSQYTVRTGDANILFLTGFPVLRDWPADWKLPGPGKTGKLQNNHHCPRYGVCLEKPVSPSHPKQQSLPGSCHHPETGTRRSLSDLWCCSGGTVSLLRCQPERGDCLKRPKESRCSCRVDIPEHALRPLWDTWRFAVWIIRTSQVASVE